MAYTVKDKKTMSKPESELYIACLSKIIRKHGSLEQNQPVSAEDQAFIDTVENRFQISIDVGEYTALGDWKILKQSAKRYTVYRVLV